MTKRAGFFRPLSLEKTMANTWKLYILRCGDGSLYTGITTDVEKRLEAHRSGKGAKYTRGRGPLELAYSEECGDHSAALKRELEIKSLSREEKLKMTIKE
jgi:putative endonuclease